MFDYALNAADLMSNRAKLTPDRIALVELDTGNQYSFKALNESASRCANFLGGKLGVGKGDRVSILSKNNVIYFDLLYGLPKIGAIFAPLNWRLTSRELVYILNDLEPKVLLIEPEFLPVYEEMKAEEKDDTKI